MELAELQGLTFRCLEGCGFCCTFQPELSVRELALLRARFRPRPLNITVDDGRAYLQLQNKCGACTLLERRGCSAYDIRPAHCRYFPFHVHFGERVEVNVNRTCRGVEPAPAGDLRAAFEQQVLQVARAEELREHERLARETYGTFERKARRAGAWGDARAAAAESLAAGAEMLTRAWVDRACARAAGPETTAQDAWEDALAPFEEPDVARRPFYLTPDLRWLTFSRPEPDALDVWEMDERGELRPHGRVDGIAAWQDPPERVREALAAYLRRLAGRGSFLGGVYALVDDSGYELDVARATLLRLAEMATDMALRARILHALGVAEDALADEVERFYDTTFLDAPTIGGWL